MNQANIINNIKINFLIHYKKIKIHNLFQKDEPFFLRFKIHPTPIEAEN